MALRGANGVQARFTRYIESLVSVIGHADRAGPLRDYCTGLIVSEARKSVEPMAAITAPDRTGAQHQSLLHFVGCEPAPKVDPFRLPTVTPSKERNLQLSRLLAPRMLGSRFGADWGSKVVPIHTVRRPASNLLG